MISFLQTLFVVLVCLSFALPSFATSRPYSKESKSLYSRMAVVEGYDALQNIALDPTQDSALLASRVAKATYNAATMGGASEATVSLGVTLPAKSIIKKAYYQIATPGLVSASNNTLAFYCGTTALTTATDHTGSYTFGNYKGGQVITAGTWDAGLAANMTYEPSACLLKAVVGTGTTGITAGKVILFVEYSVSE